MKNKYRPILYLLLIILLGVLTAGCSSKRRAIKKLHQIYEKHPELLESRRDTNYIVFQDSSRMKRDTLIIEKVVTRPLTDNTFIDTLTLEGPDGLSVELTVERDTIYKYIIKTVIEPDSIPVPIAIPVETVYTETITRTVREKYIPWWIWVVLGFVVLTFVTFLLLILKRTFYV